MYIYCFLYITYIILRCLQKKNKDDDKPAESKEEKDKEEQIQYIDIKTHCKGKTSIPTTKSSTEF